jgi:hypothetical protein
LVDLLGYHFKTEWRWLKRRDVEKEVLAKGLAPGLDGDILVGENLFPNASTNFVNIAQCFNDRF